MGIMQISDTTAGGAGVFDLPLFVHPLPVAGWSRRHVAYAVPQDPGATIASWADLAGGAPLTPNGQGGTASTAPLLVSEGSTPHMEFTGTAAMGVPMPIAQPHTIIVCARLTAQPTGLGVLTGSKAATPNRASQFLDASTNLNWRSNAGSSIGSTVTASTTTFQTLTTVFDGANSIFRVDGVEVAGNAGSEARSHLTVATWDTQGLNRLACRISEIVVYPFALNAFQRGQVEAAVAAGRLLS